MFKNNPDARVILRSALVFVGVTLASLAQATLGSDLTMGESLFALSEGFTVGLGYGGLNYASAKVNPSVGRGS